MYNVDNEVDRELCSLSWTQQPVENMYPIIKERLENYNLKWKLNKKEINKIYKEQKELWNIYHKENSTTSHSDERSVRFCLGCKMYYEPDFILKDVNINLCSSPCCPNETKGCFRKWIEFSS